MKIDGTKVTINTFFVNDNIEQIKQFALTTTYATLTLNTTCIACYAIKYLHLKIIAI